MYIRLTNPASIEEAKTVCAAGGHVDIFGTRFFVVGVEETNITGPRHFIPEHYAEVELAELTRIGGRR